MNLKFNKFTIGDNNYIESQSENNFVSVVLVSEDGYEEFFKVGMYLLEECNLKVISGDGITDMKTSFEFNGSELVLNYYSDVDGMLDLEYHPKNEQQLNSYRLLVHNINKNVLEERKIEKTK